MNKIIKEIDQQINFIKRERTMLLETVKSARMRTQEHRRLMEKIRFYSALEQNMYALRVITRFF